MVELSLILVRRSSPRRRAPPQLHLCSTSFSIFCQAHTPIRHATKHGSDSGSPPQAECVQHGLRTIAFCKTRKMCELVTAYTRETLKDTAPHLANTISVYRAGYSPEACVARSRRWYDKRA